MQPQEDGRSDIAKFSLKLEVLEHALVHDLLDVAFSFHPTHDMVFAK